MWFGKKLSYKNLHVWGCLAYIQIRKETRKKLDKTVQKCIFVGYTSMAQQYRLYDPIKRKVLISRDVVFNKLTSYYPLEDFDNTQALHYYALVSQSWEEQLAWNGEFDELDGDEDTSIKDKKVVFISKKTIYVWTDCVRPMCPVRPDRQPDVLSHPMRLVPPNALIPPPMHPARLLRPPSIQTPPSSFPSSTALV